MNTGRKTNEKAIQGREAQKEYDRSCRACIRRQNGLLLLILLSVILGTIVICLFMQRQLETVLADAGSTSTDSGVVVTRKPDVPEEQGGIEEWEPAVEKESAEEAGSSEALEAAGITAGSAVGSAGVLTEEKLQAIQSSEAWKEIFDNENLYPEALIKDLKRNPEMLDFVAGYLTAETEASGGFTRKEMLEDCPLFIQWDERWGYVPYGQSNIGISGCGPTCLSMVLYSLTRDQSLTPDVLAELAMEEGYYVSGVGTAWSFMKEIAPRYGIYSVQCDTWDESMMETYLNDGKLLILAMKPGDFTDTGHFIVVRGYSDGKLLVNDPFSYTNSSKEWDYDTIDSQCKQMWAYEAPLPQEEGEIYGLWQYFDD